MYLTSSRYEKSLIGVAVLPFEGPEGPNEKQCEESAAEFIPIFLPQIRNILHLDTEIRIRIEIQRHLESGENDKLSQTSCSGMKQA